MYSVIDLEKNLLQDSAGKIIVIHASAAAQPRLGLRLFYLPRLSADFQSRDQQDRETQEATMSVCMYVCLYVCHKR